MATENYNISTTLKKFISDKIPQKVTNVFWQMFNGIQVVFELLEYRLNINKRERNFLTAQHNSSLRHLSAQNGFEPSLKTPAKGLLKINIKAVLFNRVGYPLFLPPYSVFIDTITKLSYYYNSDKILRISDNNIIIPVVEGMVKTVQIIGNGKLIDRFYLKEDHIADKSIKIDIGGIQFAEVKSFFNNSGFNDDKQFVVKFSNDIQNPIIIHQLQRTLLILPS